MTPRASDSSIKTIAGIFIIVGVVAYLFVFHFLLGMTWMIYVLVIAVAALMLARKVASYKKLGAGAHRDAH